MCALIVKMCISISVNFFSSKTMNNQRKHFFLYICFRTNNHFQKNVIKCQESRIALKDKISFHSLLNECTVKTAISYLKLKSIKLNGKKTTAYHKNLNRHFVV